MESDEMLISNDLLISTNYNEIKNFEEDIEIKELLTKLNFFKTLKNKSQDAINIAKNKLCLLKNEEKRALSKYEFTKKKYSEIIMQRPKLENQYKIYFFERLKKCENDLLDNHEFNKTDYKGILDALKSSTPIKKQRKSNTNITKNQRISNSVNFNLQNQSKSTLSKASTINEAKLFENESRPSENNLKRQKKNNNILLRTNLENLIKDDILELKNLENKLELMEIEEKFIQKVLQTSD